MAKKGQKLKYLLANYKICVILKITRTYIKIISILARI